MQADMGRFFMGLLGIALSYFIIRKRRMLGDMLIETSWTQKLGGIHMMVVYTAIFIFFWSILTMFNLTGVIVEPLVAPFSKFGVG